jgi:hypothetical protein
MQADLFFEVCVELPTVRQQSLLPSSPGERMPVLAPFTPSELHD